MAAHNSVSKDFTVDDAVLQEFKNFLKSQNIDYTDQDIAGVEDWVKESIKSDLFTTQFGQLEGLKVRAEWDPQIAKAITYIPAAESLQEHLKLALKTNPAHN
jgi:carboxyl-terminal processing protease